MDWTTVSGKRKKDDKKIQCIEIINRKTPKAANATQIHLLNDTWVCWFHNLNSDEWSLESYQKVFTFKTVEDFWILSNNLNNINNGMYYIMRENYPPIWDHEMNIEGGGWTFKIDKKFAQEFWIKLSCYCVGEVLSNNTSNIVGISLSPKIRFVTVRIWTKNTSKNPAEFNNIKIETENDSLPINFANARFTPNREALRS